MGTWIVKRGFLMGCVKSLHKRFRSISASSALSALMPVAHSSLIVLLPPYTFIPHSPSPHPIHLDTTVAHSSLIVLLPPTPFIPHFPSPYPIHLDTAVAHSVRLCFFIQHSSFIILLCTKLTSMGLC